MKPYSLDLRQKIVDSYKNNEGSIRRANGAFAPGSLQSKDFEAIASV